MSNLVSLQEFWDMVDKFDWSYMMSDDNSAYDRGSARESRLRSIARQSPEHQAIWDGFNEYRWKKGDKPERPE